jgi:hypothetical protein
MKPVHVIDLDALARQREIAADADETPEDTQRIDEALADHAAAAVRRKLRRPELIRDELRHYASRLLQLADIAERLSAFRDQDSRKKVALEVEIGVNDLGCELQELSVTYDPRGDL